MRRTALVLPVLLVLIAGWPAPPTTLADEPEVNPFANLAGHLKLGPSVRTRGTILLALRLATPVQAGMGAHVGLSGATTSILPLPGPTGRWHVRVANQGSTPLLIPAGDTLITPLRASRSVDRPVWIPAGGASFVPVVQSVDPPPTGPYLCRGRGLTPAELSLVPSDRWGERVRLRNATYGVTNGFRRDDASAAYATEGFAADLTRYQEELDKLVAGKNVVGVVVADDRGPYFAHLETDRSRFEKLWPALRDGIVVDARMLEETGGAPRPGEEAELKGIVRPLVRALWEEPLKRPTFGEGWQYRWDLTDPTGYWEGIATPEGPACLTLYRDAPRPPGTQQPTGPGGPNEGTPTPGIAEGERREPRSEYEKRLRERRREGLRNGGKTPPGGGGAARPPAPPRPAPPRSGPSSRPAPPRVDPPGSGGGIGPRGR